MLFSGKVCLYTLALLATITSNFSYAGEMRFIQVAAKNKEARTAIANAGVSIEAIRSDSVWGFANQNAIKRLEEKGIKVLGNFNYDVGRGGHENMFGFPVADAKFHDYAEVKIALNELMTKNDDIAKVQSMGQSIEKREILALHINTNPESLASGMSNKPGAIFMGNHHAREHLSVEIPLMYAQYLLKNRQDPAIASLLDTRDIWIIPMVNPDGSEWDISTGKYKYWRKNRRNNGDGTYGVDLNRNYGFKWGTGGSDTDTSSDIYMGKAPFSEPETQAVRNFIDAHTNANVLITFHTFSELILYPWGHTYNEIGSAKDLAVFKKMAETMATWNKYTPEQASDLYIASGDTTDWAYGEHGIFAFTFELSPASMWQGGFYPGAGVIDKVFQDNIKPCMYLLEIADDPYQAVDGAPTGMLQNYVEPRLLTEQLWSNSPVF